MLKKIYKHDTILVFRKSLPFIIAALITSAAVCALKIFLYSMESFYETVEETHALMLAIELIVPLVSIASFGAIILSILPAAIAERRYFKSIYSDEGYLTMVLPVKIERLFRAKVLSLITWIAVSALLVGISVFLADVVPDLVTNSYGPTYEPIPPEPGEILFEIVIIFFIFSIVAMNFELFLMLPGMIGSASAKKRSTLGALVTFGIVMAEVTIFLSTILDFEINHLFDEGTSFFYQESLFFGIYAVILLALAVVFRFGAVHLLKYRYNLD